MPRIAIQSEFFLHQDQWRVLREEILPGLLRGSRTLRCWSAGCHVGKEPYSLAILLDELAPDEDWYLLATDKYSDLVRRAEAGGPFSGRDVRQLSRRQRETYLCSASPPFFVVNRLVRRVSFRRHDLLTEPCETAFDLILFRDVQPFFTSAQSAVVYSKLFASLGTSGVLLTGAMDSIPHWRELGFRRLGPALFQKP